ncbi:MAG: phosphopantothenoylcysteine decarboxylase/phosphopantothenate/cysteine ligase [Clostridia bacterium]|nr:phosphopantothenoylcysteine decarboxylase/phosphopantothenate/cysteine ligase [Clostridia bacterium]
MANNIAEKNAGFKTDTNIAAIIDKEGNVKEYPLMSKRELAGIILDKVQNLL